MKKTLYFLAIVLISIITACNSENPETKKEKRIAKGDVNYGGVLNISETKRYEFLHPHEVTNNITYRIASQIYEGLLRYDTKTKTVLPSIAARWEISKDSLVYTFYLKKGVVFHDYPEFPEGKGREVNANDFKYSFELLSKYSNNNKSFEKTIKDKVVGANDFHYSDKNDTIVNEISGIKVIDDYTLEIHLVKPYFSFPNILAMPELSVLPKEVIEKDGKKSKIGTGPFFVEAENDNNLILARNDNYHRIDSLGNSLPYLDTIYVKFIKKDNVLKAFKNEEVDIISGIESEETKEAVVKFMPEFKTNNPKYAINQIPDVITYFIQFNTNNEIFKDQKLREVINKAIDKNKIIKKILNVSELSKSAEFGITPLASFPDYDTIKGIDNDIETAKKLLQKSGYKYGKELIVKLVCNGSEKENIVITQEIQSQLESKLPIRINYVSATSNEDMLRTIKKGNYDIILTKCIADIPSPESFLSLFYSKNISIDEDNYSAINYSNFSNEEFDMYFEKGISASSKEEYYKNLAKAESLLINTSVVIPIWYPETVTLFKSKISGLLSSTLKYVDYSKIYFKAQQPAD